MDTLSNVAAAIGAVVTVGGGFAVIAYAIFKSLGEKWLEQKFATQLEAFKHEQDKEMEQVRYRVNSLFDRAVRLHQAEFEVVPETWAKMQEAYSQATYFLSPARLVPDLNKMTPAHLEEWLEASRLHNFEKQELRAATDKFRYYSHTIFWHELQDAKKPIWEYRAYLTKNGVFIKPELEEKFSTIAQVIWESLIEREVHGEKGMEWYERPANKKFRDEVPGLIVDIKGAVQGTLWDSKQG